MPARGQSGLLAALATALLAGACAVVPTVPGGPLQRAGTTQLALTPIVDMSIVTTTVMTGDPPATPSAGTSRATKGGMDAGTVSIPPRAGGRVALADWADLALDWDLSGVGGEIRAGTPEGTRWPFAVSIGARSGALFSIAIGSRIRDQYDMRARVEVYPRLSPPTGQVARRQHAIVALGISQGLHYHRLTLQDGLDQWEFMREETRVEGALGIESRTNRSAISLVALPYVVARGSFPTEVSCGIAHCIQFDGRRLVAYRQDLGLSLALVVTAWIL